MYREEFVRISDFKTEIHGCCNKYCKKLYYCCMKIEKDDDKKKLLFFHWSKFQN